MGGAAAFDVMNRQAWSSLATGVLEDAAIAMSHRV
jgi:hypothetical protein